MPVPDIDGDRPGGLRITRPIPTASPRRLDGDSSALPRVNPLLGLVVATVGVSFAAVFISAATTPPLVTATWRMALTVLLLGPLLWPRRGALAGLSRGDYGLIGAAGVLLALHFATWTVSIFYTSVASSVLFVTVHPVLVAALAWSLGGERPRRVVVLGIALALLGSLIIAGGDVRLGGRALAGDGLALAGAAVFAVYLLIGRRVRQRLDPITYSAPVYLVCALALGLLALLGGQAFDPRSWRNLALFAALALVCTVGGHLVYNWTLGHLDAAVVSVSFLGEPVIAALLAWPLLGQPLQPLTMLGGVVIVAGLYLTTTGSRPPDDNHQLAPVDVQPSA